MGQHDYTDKVTLVTGGGSGSEGCALTFARQGPSVVADYDQDGGDRVTETIRAEGLDATFVEVDVSKPEQIEAMVAKTVRPTVGSTSQSITPALEALRRSPANTQSTAGRGDRGQSERELLLDEA